MGTPDSNVPKRVTQLSVDTEKPGRYVGKKFQYRTDGKPTDSVMMTDTPARKRLKTGSHAPLGQYVHRHD